MWIQNWTSNDPLTFYLLTSSMKHIYSLFIPVGLWLHKEKQLLASVIDVFIGSDYPCCCASYLLNTHTQKKNLKSTALKHTSYVFFCHPPCLLDCWVLGFVVLPPFYLPSLCPPPLPPVFCAPVSADFVPSQRLPSCLPTREYRRLPKSRKRRCVTSGHAPSTLTFSFSSHFCLSVCPLLPPLPSVCLGLQSGVTDFNICFCLWKKNVHVDTQKH